MHDPNSVAFEIRYPWRKYAPGMNRFFPKGYRESFITIWHLDPEKNGSDDSCRWFQPNRPWWKHPRFHFWHWRFQIHPLQDFKRWAFTKCSFCKQRFSWGYSPISTQWGDKGPQWFKSETYVFHEECMSKHDQEQNKFYTAAENEFCNCGRSSYADYLPHTWNPYNHSNECFYKQKFWRDRAV